MSEVDITIDYYNQNAVDFIKHTINVDFEQNQQRFLGKLKPGSQILDFGCGSGRDTKYFLNKGFFVEAVDGSKELCSRAAAHTGIPVKQMLFSELAEQQKYDGIWACSSILHLSWEELAAVLHRMSDALKDKGIVYASFKYGSYSGVRNGRYFTDMTEERLKELVKTAGDFKEEEIWITGDVRQGRDDEKWLNTILRKRI